MPVISKGQLWGGFVAVRRLGKGQFGEVWQAVETVSGAPRALKFLSDAGAQLARELRAAQYQARLQHPNIVQLYEVAQVEHDWALVMEYVDGGNLRHRLGQDLPGWRQAVEWTFALCQALAHAHGRGFIHRDLKPENLLLALDGTLKVTDFGLAHLAGIPGSRIAGTLPYMAPEQLDGEEDRRADLWAVGVLLYEMLTGRLAFPGESDREVIRQVRSGPLPRIAPGEMGIPFPVGEILGRLLERDVERRYQTAQAIVEDLAGLQTQEGPSPRKEQPASPPGEGAPAADEEVPPSIDEEPDRLSHRLTKRMKRGVGSVVAAFVLAMLLGAGAWYTFHRDRGSEPVTPSVEAPQLPFPTSQEQAPKPPRAASPGPSLVPKPTPPPAGQTPPKAATSQQRTAAPRKPKTGGAGVSVAPGGVSTVPDQAQRHLTSGREAYQARNYLRAVREFEEAVRLASKDAQAHVELALAYAALGNRGRTIQALERAVALEPNHVGYRRHLVLAYSEANEHAKAREQWQAILRLDPANVEARQALGFQ